MGVLVLLRSVLLLVPALALAACSSAPPRDLGAAVAQKSEPSLPVPAVSQEAATDYRIGPHDLVVLRVIDLEKVGDMTTFELEVSGQGEIAAPFVGLVSLNGKTVSEARQLVIDRLARFIVEPQVSLTIKEYRSHEIGVIGAVEKPGVVYLNRNRVTLVEALSRGGGLNKEAGTKAVILRPMVASVTSNAAGIAPTSSAMVTEVVDLIPILLRGEENGGPVIEPGCVVQVPAAEDFYVTGFVNKGGAFPYKRPTTVHQAIEAAGGMDEHKASPSCVTIQRKHGAETSIIEVDLTDVAAGNAPDVAIFPGDSIRVGRTVVWAVFTELIDTIRGVFTTGFGFSRPF